MTVLRECTAVTGAGGAYNKVQPAGTLRYSRCRYRRAQGKTRIGCGGNGICSGVAREQFRDREWILILAVS